MSAIWKNKRIKVGDRVMDKSIGHAGTVERLIPSAVLPDWTCAYVVRYDQAPPMEYNMGCKEGLVFAKRTGIAAVAFEWRQCSVRPRSFNFQKQKAMKRFLVMWAMCIVAFGMAWWMICTDIRIVQWLAVIFTWTASLAIGRWWRGWHS